MEALADLVAFAKAEPDQLEAAVALGNLVATEATLLAREALMESVRSPMGAAVIQASHREAEASVETLQEAVASLVHPELQVEHRQGLDLVLAD